MEKIRFKIVLKAKPQKVWETLWNDESYRKWTSPFTEGSYAVSDWKEGSKILFLAPSGEGMVSMIDIMRPYEYLSFRHIGFVKDGVEDLASEEVKKWSGAEENYSLTDLGDSTELEIELDGDEGYMEHLKEAWPKALTILKDLAESEHI